MSIEQLEQRELLSGDSVVVFNEVMYHPLGDAAGLEWIELFNQHAVNVDLSKWRIAGAVDYQFAEGTVIAGRGYLVVAADPAALQAATGFGGAVGPFTGRLANEGEELRLLDNNLRVMNTLAYGDSGDWPVGPDGSGATLAKIDQLGGSETPANWTHSQQVGGTPGAENFADAGQGQTGPSLVIDEVAPAAAEAFWVEIANLGPQVADLGGYMLVARDSGATYTLPAEIIPSGGFRAVTAAETGFQVADGERLFLFGPGRIALIDARQVTAQLRGRAPQRDGQWLYPDRPTPGEANHFNFHEEIVINEIMYHAPPQLAGAGQAFAESNEEWIELYNRGTTAVDLTGWTLREAIDFDFPAGTTIATGALLVVAKDAAALAAKYPAIDILGNYDRTLSDAGDRILLRDAAGNPADDVHYYDSGRWGERADGGGSSLELRDPDADNSLPEAWASSDEGGKSQWQTYTSRRTAQPYLGTFRSSVGGAVPPRDFNDFVFGLLDAGEVLLDDIHVIEDPNGAAIELIQNTTFQGDALGTVPYRWRIGGNHEGQVITDPSDPGNKVLRLVARGAAGYVSNSAETTFINNRPIVIGRQYQVSFRAKWIGGSRQLNSRAFFTLIPETTQLAAPELHGTPGVRNSRYEPNVGPTYRDLRHTPVVPQPQQAVTVSIAAQDPDGIASARLFWSTGGAFSSALLTRGTDGRYAGTIPGQCVGTIVQFYVEAADGLGIVSTFPAAGPNSRALYEVNDGAASVAETLGTDSLRVILTTADTNFLHADTNLMSDDFLGATLVVNESEVFYDIGARLRGSEHSRSVSAGLGFTVQLEADHLYRGVHRQFAIDRGSRSSNTPKPSPDEIIIRQFMNHAGGVPSEYDDIVYVVAPRSAENSPAVLRLAEFGDVYLDTQFDGGSDSPQFEFDMIFTPPGFVGGDPNNPKVETPGPFYDYDLEDLGDDKEVYRYELALKNSRDADDYSRIIQMSKAMGMPAGAAFDAAVAEAIDVDQWMRAFATKSLTMDFDGYGSVNYRHNQNVIFYVRPSDQKVIALPYDIDGSFNTSFIPTNAPIYPQGVTNLAKLIQRPANLRLYYGHLQDMIATTWNRAYMEPWMVHFGQKAGQNLTVNLGLIDARASYVLSHLPASVPFAITTNSGNNFSINDVKVTLVGAGWINVREIRVNGKKAAPSWTSASAWEVTLPLDPGANVLNLQAYDFHGLLIASDSITVTSTAPPAALRKYLRITEINYNPVGPTPAELLVNPNFDNDDFEFIELINTSTSTTINLQGTSFTAGVTFSFTTSRELARGERVLLVRKQDAFLARYPAVPAAQIVGVYSGKLSNNGDRIALLDGDGLTITDFSYGTTGAWPGRAEGKGSTLEVINTSGDYSDPNNWRASAEYNGSPGQAGVGAMADVIVNEVLTHSDQPLVDAIELYNTTSNTIDISGWWLSDTNDDYFKFQVPAGTVLTAHGYVVFQEGHWVNGLMEFAVNGSGEYTEFGGGAKGFGLNGARGDDVWLVQADTSGNITRFADHAEFGAMATGESLGRWLDDQGNWHFYPLRQRTLGQANHTGGNGPRVGPLVISEVMYSPKAPLYSNETTAGFTSLDQMEYVEIYNPTGSAVDLTNWRLAGAVTYPFAAHDTLPARTAMLVVSFDATDSAMLSAFRASTRYRFGATVKVVGSFSGHLSDTGDTLRLLRPDAPPPDEPSFYPALLEDEACYASSWGGNGDRKSLTRRSTDAWGMNQGSWAGAATSAGAMHGVAGRYVFYNHSSFDKTSGAGTSDDAAIATDKTPLLPGGQASFVNYTSYSRGINGIMVDLLSPPGTVVADDFIFRVGNDNNPALWTAAPAPTSVSQRTVSGATRVTMIWADGAIENQWLQVTVLANATTTGLPLADVFYFGNAIGETGNPRGAADADAEVDASDEAAVRAAATTSLPALTSNPYDFNRDRRINATDELIARANRRVGPDALQLIDLTLVGQSASQAAVQAAPAQVAESVPAAGPAATSGGAPVPSAAATSKLPLAAAAAVAPTRPVAARPVSAHPPAAHDAVLGSAVSRASKRAAPVSAAWTWLPDFQWNATPSLAKKHAAGSRAVDLALLTSWE